MATPAVVVVCPPAWNVGAGGNAFVPGLVRKHGAFWDEVVLQERPLRGERFSCWCLEHGASSAVVPYFNIFLVEA